MKKQIACILLGLFMISIPTIGFAKGDTLQKNQDPFETESKNYSTIGEILPLVKPDSVEDSIKKPSVLLHEVVKGDTLYALAHEYDTTVEQIMDNNELESSLILIGQTLKIEENSKEKVKQAKASQTKSVSSKQKDRKSTRLNSSHVAISYAVFCLKKK